MSWRNHWSKCKTEIKKIGYICNKEMSYTLIKSFAEEIAHKLKKLKNNKNLKYNSVNLYLQSGVY